MQPSDLRIALFSGNYNYVRDGANQALNRLVGYLLRQGAQVRVYSPTVDEPAFPPTGDLISVPSIAIPGREEYRLGLSLTPSVRRDLAAFDPNVVHVAAPDIVAHRAVSWARARGIPAVASVHTRFDTYLSYYGLENLEPLVRAIDDFWSGQSSTDPVASLPPDQRAQLIVHLGRPESKSGGASDRASRKCASKPWRRFSLSVEGVQATGRRARRAWASVPSSR